MPGCKIRNTVRGVNEKLLGVVTSSGERFKIANIDSKLMNPAGLFMVSPCFVRQNKKITAAEVYQQKRWKFSSDQLIFAEFPANFCHTSLSATLRQKAAYARGLKLGPTLSSLGYS